MFAARKAGQMAAHFARRQGGQINFAERAKVIERSFTRIYDGFSRSSFVKPFARDFLRDHSS